ELDLLLHRFPLRFDTTRDTVRSLVEAEGLHVFRAARPTPGNPRPADPQGRGAWTSAWLGHFRAPSSNLQRHTPDPTGIALSCASSPRATRVDQIALGHIG